MLGYESEKYSDDEDADGTNHAKHADRTNHSDLKLVKRGITRLYKFRREYGKPGGIKIKEKSARGKMARSKNVYHHKMGRGGYVFVKEKMIENKEIEADEEPPRGIMWLKGRVNKDGEFTDDEIRSVGDKLKEADDKIKEGTLNLDDGTDAMTVVFGKEKGGYARGVGSGVTYKRYFHLPRSRQATDERIELLQTQLDNERRERQQKDVLVKKLSTEMTEKDVLVKKLSNEMTETKGMLSQLMNQLAAQGVQLNLSSQLQVASDVTPMGAYEVDGTQSSVVVRDKDARIQKKSNGLVTSRKEPVKTVGPKKTPKSRRNGSQDSQSQGNVSPTQELPTASKCKLWHLKKSNIVALGTVYKSDRKQMLHNQALLNDCYKVSIDSSLVDTACIDVGNNRLKTVKDGVGGFFAWPKNQVVLDEEVTPPTTIQKISDYNSAPKLQSKRKNYVSRETMQRQARTGKSHKSLNYGS
ncbi:nucleotide-binding alpha-beta plait domain-containing protein [Tanacetum coccineum]